MKGTVLDGAALAMHETDTVATALEDLDAGRELPVDGVLQEVPDDGGLERPADDGSGRPADDGGPGHLADDGRGRPADDAGEEHPADDAGRAAATDDAGRAADASVSPAEPATITLAEDVPFGHKVALVGHERGAAVRKYGEVIGRTTVDVAAGEWVHTHNCESTRGRGDLAVEEGRP